MNNRRKQSDTLARILADTEERDFCRMRNRMLVAAKIADALKVRHISQKRFAEMIGRSEPEVSEWLSGDRNFTIDTLSDVSVCLGIRLLDVSYSKAVRIPDTFAEVKVTKRNKLVSFQGKNKGVLVHASDKWIVETDGQGVLLAY